MKRLLGLTAFMALAACALHAQAVNTTVCDVLRNPASFNGKTVTIKGTVVVGFDQFVLNDTGTCAGNVNGIWLDYPPGAKAKAGPLAMVEISPAKNFAGAAAAANRPAVTLTKDKAFKQFDSALSQWRSLDSGLCLGCAKYTVQATITGRLDGVKDTVLKRDNGKIVSLGGFGNVNQYPARLVIASVADVTTKEVDYSKAEAAVKELEKGERNPQQGSPSPITSYSYSDAKDQADKMASQMAASPLTDQIKKDLGFLPKGKEQSSVVITEHTANEVPANEGTPGSVDSPDGLIYTCSLNRDRLSGLGMPMAVLHVAQHVSDVRSPLSGDEEAPLAILENNAWAVTSTLGIFGGEKLIVADAGYILWNLDWPKADQINNMQAAQTDLISKGEQLNR